MNMTDVVSVIIPDYRCHVSPFRLFNDTDNRFTRKRGRPQPLGRSDVPEPIDPKPFEHRLR
jgi:hypothetical protein